MLAREIADLTGLRLVRITRGGLARHVRIEVAVGGGAVAVGTHWEGVDVVDYTLSQLQSEMTKR